MTGVWNSYYSFFVNDNWRATHRLTLNVGLRYDYNTVIHDPTHKVENFNLATLSLEPGTKSFYNPNWLDFSPRVGFNWDPYGSGRTSIKGGYGIFFLPIAPGDLLNLATNTNQNISVNIYPKSHVQPYPQYLVSAPPDFPDVYSGCSIKHQLCVAADPGFVFGAL